MISEIDIRDWQDNIVVARDIVDGGQRSKRPLTSVDNIFMQHFIDKVEALVVSDTKQLAALFKPKDHPAYD
jgi:hypothetical protein